MTGPGLAHPETSGYVASSHEGKHITSVGAADDHTHSTEEK